LASRRPRHLCDVGRGNTDFEKSIWGIQVFPDVPEALRNSFIIGNRGKIQVAKEAKLIQIA